MQLLISHTICRKNAKKKGKLIEQLRVRISFCLFAKQNMFRVWVLFNFFSFHIFLGLDNYKISYIFWISFVRLGISCMRFLYCFSYIVYDIIKIWANYALLRKILYLYVWPSSHDVIFEYLLELDRWHKKLLHQSHIQYRRKSSKNMLRINLHRSRHEISNSLFLSSIVR